jgi:hypothetical protein
VAERLHVTNEEDIRNVNNNGGRDNPGYSRAAMVTAHVR